MCGFAGYLSERKIEHASEILASMGQALFHRGPDDDGVWMDAESGIGLSHQRLSILDLSVAGHQPMISSSGRYVIVFNGEIYNHLDLRRELASDCKWRGHSDTETLLAAFESWGIEASLKKTVGMFGFALWDRKERLLILARDRMGEKPLYYGWQNGTFLFASDLKALKFHPAFRAEIDRNALTLLLRHSCIPSPYSIYQNIYKLPPGSFLKVSLTDRELLPQYYWDIKRVIVNGIERPFGGSREEAVNKLDQLLREAVAQQMIADVPLGVFLSGGVDSSTVVALMQAQSTRRVRTFTIGLNEENHNEAKYAKDVAEHLGTDHTEFYVSPQETLEVISKLPDIYCEPFSDPSQIPTFLVSQLARKHVTVSLSGDAGDELFGGYNRYILGQRLWKKLSLLPRPVRTALAKSITQVPPQHWNRVLGPLQKVLPLGLAQANVGEKMHKGAGVMASRTPAELYRLLVSHWSEPAELVVGASEPLTALTRLPQLKTDHFVHDMMAFDSFTYLPDDILCKVDRAAMGVSLETRVPLLDHRVFEFAWQLPLSYKIVDGVGKWPLRQVLYKYVPKKLIERPKMGFGIPIDQWLRGPLREWAEELLSESRLQREGYFNPRPIRQKWAEHLSGKRNWQHHLWDVLMAQAWLEKEKR